jgi:7,8-dihydroneopterin aldolase/epimerase/oxygenase
MMDTIYLSGIKAFGYTGALPEENVLGQWFEAEITLYIDLVQASQNDNLADTCDYRNVVEEALKIIREGRFKLIERMAGAIATATLNCDQRLQQVKVKVTKLTPPIPDYSGQISVELTRVAQPLS